MNPTLHHHLTKQYVLDRIEVDPNSGCWNWARSIYKTTGYGQIGYYPHTTHRLAFILWKGWPTLPVIRHLCHNVLCCNPAHLAEGTHADNWKDSADKHLAHAALTVGRPAKNRIPVTIHGEHYPSLKAAQDALGITHRQARSFV